MSTALGFTANIAPELMPLARPIGEAIPHPDNPRKHRIDKIAKSLQQHGQRSPIVVQQSTSFIVKGNGTHEAARMLGWDQIAMVFQELTDGEAYAYLLDDNRASDLSTYDNEKLHAALEKMVEGPGLADSLWEVEEFEDLDERINGSVTLAPAETGAAYINDEEKDAAKKASLAQTAKMREVPVMMEAADYPVFMEWVRVLQKVYGATGTQVTIYEAVHRQYLLEAEGKATVGRSASQKQLDHAVRLSLGDVRQILFDRYGAVDQLSRAAVLDLIQSMMPKPEAEAPAVVPGQTEAFPVAVADVPNDDPATTPAPDPKADSEGEEGKPQGEPTSAPEVVPATDGSAPAVAPEPGDITEDELAAEFEAAMARDTDAAFQQAVIAEFEHGGDE